MVNMEIELPKWLATETVEFVGSIAMPTGVAPVAKGEPLTAGPKAPFATTVTALTVLSFTLVT